MSLPRNSSRIVLVDALRGFALAGVALVHMGEQYVAGPLPEVNTAGLNGIADQVFMGLVQLFFVGKFLALFSILFGLSFSIQMDSAAHRGDKFAVRFIWRAGLLLCIGFVHHLFYRGDILVIYAVLAPLLVLFRNLDSRWLLALAVACLLGLPRFLVFAVQGYSSLFGLPVGLSGPEEAAYLAAIQTGSLWEVFNNNLVYGLQVLADYQLVYSGRFYLTFGYFLIGLWLGRIGLFRAPERFHSRLKKTIWWAIPIWIGSIVMGGAAFATSPQPVDFSQWQHVFALNCFDWASVALTAIIGSVFILWYQKDWWHGKLSFFAPYGRMALTNYVLQSLLGTALFYGWGLGLLGQVRYLHLLVMAVCLITLHCLVSKYWLSVFRFGPLEWAWRVGTYLKYQPFRQSSK